MFNIQPLLVLILCCIGPSVSLSSSFSHTYRLLLHENNRLKISVITSTATTFSLPLEESYAQIIFPACRITYPRSQEKNKHHLLQPIAWLQMSRAIAVKVTSNLQHRDHKRASFQEMRHRSLCVSKIFHAFFPMWWLWKAGVPGVLVRKGQRLLALGHHLPLTHVNAHAKSSWLLTFLQ